jgi:hypothetical protein
MKSTAAAMGMGADNLNKLGQSIGGLEAAATSQNWHFSPSIPGNVPDTSTEFSGSQLLKVLWELPAGSDSDPMMDELGKLMALFGPKTPGEPSADPEALQVVKAMKSKSPEQISEDPNLDIFR